MYVYAGSFCIQMHLCAFMSVSKFESKGHKDLSQYNNNAVYTPRNYPSLISDDIYSGYITHILQWKKQKTKKHPPQKKNNGNNKLKCFSC